MLPSGRDGKCNIVSMRIFFGKRVLYTQCVNTRVEQD